MEPDIVFHIYWNEITIVAGVFLQDGADPIAECSQAVKIAMEAIYAHPEPASIQ